MIKLPVYEIFYSLQGEGRNVGMAACFVRLAGCNVGCDFCDEKKAWSKSNSVLMNADEILQKVKEFSATNVIVTGGEPTLYDLSELTKSLHDSGIKTYIETSGVNPITGFWDWITLSPKKNKLPLPKSLQKANELKVVIEQEKDFIFAENMRSQAITKKDSDVIEKVFYLQPEYSKKETVLPIIEEYIKANPVWRLSLQMHKMINVK